MRRGTPWVPGAQLRDREARSAESARRGALRQALSVAEQLRRRFENGKRYFVRLLKYLSNLFRHVEINWRYRKF